MQDREAVKAWARGGRARGGHPGARLTGPPRPVESAPRGRGPTPGRTTILDSGIARSLLLLSLLAGIAGGTPVDARGDVYKWVDENG
jgi:hypothetical protein